MARYRSSATLSSLALLLPLCCHVCVIRALSTRTQTHRVYEDPAQMKQPQPAVASMKSRSRFDIPASPAVAMNLPADDADDGSIGIAAAQTRASASTDSAVLDAAEPTALLEFNTAFNIPAGDDNSGRQTEPSSSSSSSSSQQAGMFWNPDASWDAWGLGGSDQLNRYGVQQHPADHSSFSIQISTASSGDSPTKIQISGALNGYGLDLDWQQEDAMKVVQAVEDQMAEAMLSVEDVFNNMLVDSTQGLVRSLDILAHGGLLDWQQKLFGGVVGGLRRRLKQSGGGKVDLLRLLVPASV